MQKHKINCICEYKLWYNFNYQYLSAANIFRAIFIQEDIMMLVRSTSWFLILSVSCTMSYYFSRIREITYPFQSLKHYSLILQSSHLNGFLLSVCLGLTERKTFNISFDNKCFERHIMKTIVKNPSLNNNNNNNKKNLSHLNDVEQSHLLFQQENQ